MAISLPDREGRSTFEFILKQVRSCISDIKPFFDCASPQQIYASHFLLEVEKMQVEQPRLDSKQLALGDIAYAIVFYGLGAEDFDTFYSLYLRFYQPRFLKYLVFYIKRKPHPDSGYTELWNLFAENEKPKILANLSEDLLNIEGLTPKLDAYQVDLANGFQALTVSRPFKFYGGHQFKLSHYYRHLFQTVSYINSQKVYSYKEKYEFAKTLRAQLSTPEQYLLFFNSLSKAGREWELAHLVGKVKHDQVNNYLITKYNMIKNLPQLDFMDSININDFYPLVDFEFKQTPAGRSEMAKHFK